MRGDLKIIIERQFNFLRALDISQDRIQRIARPKIRQLFAFAAKCPDAQIQNIVTTVTGDNLPGLKTKLRAEFLPEHFGGWIWIQAKPIIQCGTQGGINSRRRWIRIFVCIELNETRHLRLFAGNVTGHLLDIFSRVIHFNRIRADAPCAVKPSTSANACKVGNDFRNATGVYSIKLVRRIN